MLQNYSDPVLKLQFFINFFEQLKINKYINMKYTSIRIQLFISV